MTVNLYLLNIVDYKLDISVVEINLDCANVRNLFSLCITNIGFMLKTEEEIKSWNKFWKKAFGGVDDDVYYHYEHPEIPFANRWYCYDVDGCLYEFLAFLQMVKEHLEYYKELETALEGL